MPPSKTMTVKEVQEFLDSVRSAALAAGLNGDDVRIKVQTKQGAVKNIVKTVLWSPSGFPHMITD